MTTLAMDSQSFERIERMNYLFGALLVAVAVLVAPLPYLFGIAVGVAITCVNFTTVCRLVRRLLAAAPEQRGTTAFYFVPKMVALIAAVAAAIYFLPIAPLGLAIGFSIFLLSIAVESFRIFRTTTPPAP